MENGADHHGGEDTRESYDFSRLPNRKDFELVVRHEQPSRLLLIPAQKRERVQGAIARSALVEANNYPHFSIGCQIAPFEIDLVIPVHPAMKVSDVFAMSKLLMRAEILNNKATSFAEAMSVPLTEFPDLNDGATCSALERLEDTHPVLVNDIWVAIADDYLDGIQNGLYMAHCAALDDAKAFYGSFESASPKAGIQSRLDFSRPLHGPDGQQPSA